MRYIFQNPLRAGITDNIKNYRWSNYKDYIEKNKITDNDFVLNIFNAVDREKAVKNFIEYINQENGDECMDMPEKRQLTDDEAMKIIKYYCKIEQTIDIQNFDKQKRNLYLRKLKEDYNLSIRQIERLTGISRGIIRKI